ncbi:TonB-dependent receptor [Sphingomonas astaxanthinifaciens]|uniref:TonB-dependent receptor n=1 Tax=Sphingomonas astaxanthinifaciens DSM 22298 TaxID=1123267 RepID=A0ABQ5Z421_9SPHN|nr:TonB-dependent receptor [Sphingomonas astaxanthinifaciens]GLR46699.1 TonB-dependent receptor [Sphingomonas astaxanthinifaciens DSM 22298]
MRASIIRSALFASAALFVAMPAAAQSAEQTNQEAAKQPPAPEATGAADNEGKDSGEGDIVVTARRVEENLQRVPASVSAFNERALDRLQATDTTGLQGAVPNLNIVQGRGSSNATNIFIRGIGQPDALQTFDPAVGVYVDDVYLSRIRGNQLDLLDVERVEVLRGPQGTLYGKNTIGGAIKFVSRRPGQQARANIQATIGSYGEVTLRGAASGPITSTLAAGIAVQQGSTDGFVKDRVLDRRYNNRDGRGVRGTLAFTPSEKVRIDLTGDYSKDDARLNVGRPLNNLVSAFGVVLPVSGITGSYDWTARTTATTPNSTRLKHRGLAGTVAVDLTDALTFKSITAQRWLDTKDFIDIDATEWQVGDVYVGVDQKQFSQEFQLAYNGGRFSGVAGLYYLKEDVASHQEAYANDFLRFSLLLPPITFLRTIDDDLTTKSYAAYANGSYEIVDNLRLSAGIRFTRESKDYYRQTSTFSSSPLFTSLTPFVFDVYGKWHDTSPMVSLDWQASPATLVYVRAAKGFKSGGFNGRANSAAERTAYDPEKVWSYEGGVKTRIGSQLRFNAAVFWNDYKDFQARVTGVDEDASFPGLPAPRLSVLNAGKLRIKGAELEATWTPVERLLIDAQLGILDADYKKFTDLRFPGGSRAFQEPAFAPKRTFRIGAQYGFDLGSAGSITLGGQSRYRSRTALAVDSTYVVGNVGTTNIVPGLFQKAYWLYDARVVWDDPSKRFSVGVYGNNLTDKAYKTDAQEFSSVGQIRTVYYGAPRTWQLKLTARY